MIPVRYNGAPLVTRVFPDGPSRHMVDECCPACDEPLDDDPVALVYIGPGGDPADQAKARDGRWHTGAAVAVHAACAGVAGVESEETP